MAGHKREIKEVTVETPSGQSLTFSSEFYTFHVDNDDMILYIDPIEKPGEGRLVPMARVAFGETWVKP